MAHPTATTEAHVALPEESSGRQYVLLPSWVLVPQVFLALGWLRAAIGHAIRPEWWSGQDIRDFIADQSGETILGYDHFLDGAILSIPSVIAGVVFALQFIIGVALFFNWRPVMALSLGAFLNVNFMLAGVVNPSIFYLVLAATIAAWRMDERWSAGFKATVARRFSPLAFLLGAALLTAVQSVHPGTVTEDPAAVLIFFLLILVAVTWSLYEYDRPVADGSAAPEGRDHEAIEPVASSEDDPAIGYSDPVESDSIESESAAADESEMDDAGLEQTQANATDSNDAEPEPTDRGDTGEAETVDETEESDSDEAAADSSAPGSDGSDDLDSLDAEDAASPDEAFALVDKP